MRAAGSAGENIQCKQLQVNLLKERNTMLKVKNTQKIGLEHKKGQMCQIFSFASAWMCFAARKMFLLLQGDLAFYVVQKQLL